jgi:hypothetical protein
MSKTMKQFRSEYGRENRYLLDFKRTTKRRAERGLLPFRPVIIELLSLVVPQSCGPVVVSL